MSSQPSRKKFSTFEPLKNLTLSMFSEINIVLYTKLNNDKTYFIMPVEFASECTDGFTGSVYENEKIEDAVVRILNHKSYGIFDFRGLEEEFLENAKILYRSNSSTCVILVKVNAGENLRELSATCLSFREKFIERVKYNNSVIDNNSHLLWIEYINFMKLLTKNDDDYKTVDGHHLSVVEIPPHLFDVYVIGEGEVEMTRRPNSKANCPRQLRYYPQASNEIQRFFRDAIRDGYDLVDNFHEFRKTKK